MSTITNKQQDNFTRVCATELTSNELNQVAGGNFTPHHRVLPGDEQIVVPAL